MSAGSPLTAERTLPPRFDPGPIEARWQAAWEAAQIAVAPERPSGPTFSMVLPPPNVTGVLTLGHYLGNTVMDVLARRARMQGRSVAWIPGVDHAGLATQVEVRRDLQRKGVDFDALDRAEALAAIEAWKSSCEATIREQMRAGGFTVDWSRFRYTKDPASERATRRVFVELYRRGLVYRAERMVNWDVRYRTAVSDLEVVHTEERDELYYVRYAFADGSPGGVDVATVRPETIFGDVAVAVHPEDERYRHLVGRTVTVPLTDRAVPVIADSAVDPTFGAGALKITPRHDPVDYEIYRRHGGLPMPPDVLDEAGRLTGPWVPAAFQRLGRDEGRRRVVQALAAAGLLVRTETITHTVGRSERSEEVIEPRLSEQWFVRMAPLAAPAVAAVERGEIAIYPERWRRTFFRWMEAIQDWCVSRQVLWGHPIPAYVCRRGGHWTVAESAPAACATCGDRELTPSPEVLDTWFTSWLWPFLALGWPEESPLRAAYYPTSVLVTGRDIMFFWVARMMMAGYAFTGQPPFRSVYFTGMLRDEHGRRLSKHLHNSPDPRDVARQRGTDTLRFALVFPNPTEEDGPFGAASLDGAAHFLTKLWNLVRFAEPFIRSRPSGAVPPRPETLEARWILERFRRTIDEVDAALDRFAVTAAAQAAYRFVWHDLADRYVELAKDALLGERGPAVQAETAAALGVAVRGALALLHPFVPHVTEELHHALAPSAGLLAQSTWPSSATIEPAPESEEAIAPLFEAIRLLRNVRSEENVAPRVAIRAYARPWSPAARAVLTREARTVVRLARLAGWTVLGEADPAPPGTIRRTSPYAELYVELARGSASSEAESRERARLEALAEKARQRLQDPTFLDRAPPAVVGETRAKLKELEERLARLGGSSAKPPAAEEAP